ncbi:uncharacterized protein BJ171DRAFT_203929 [Polychytrium aggregatum]|uniref:uncharacterized protein n=1 Tax=Polychytrium aggregatum TaxID=110093 RepID=UPI0022FE2901|nr:uncharacterized protein BJ171DRAFT_203929 [Polychytrium aggregatum]KAI9199542.1 hypothetical protein BJ171DRAFT_203929 [Polychytrium aggregatum]
MSIAIIVAVVCAIVVVASATGVYLWRRRAAAKATDVEASPTAVPAAAASAFSARSISQSSIPLTRPTSPSVVMTINTTPQSSHHSPAATFTSPTETEVSFGGTTWIYRDASQSRSRTPSSSYPKSPSIGSYASQKTLYAPPQSPGLHRVTTPEPAVPSSRSSPFTEAKSPSYPAQYDLSLEEQLEWQSVTNNSSHLSGILDAETIAKGQALFRIPPRRSFVKTPPLPSHIETPVLESSDVPVALSRPPPEFALPPIPAEVPLPPPAVLFHIDPFIESSFPCLFDMYISILWLAVCP